MLVPLPLLSYSSKIFLLELVEYVFVEVFLQWNYDSKLLISAFEVQLLRYLGIILILGETIKF